MLLAFDIIYADAHIEKKLMDPPPVLQLNILGDSDFLYNPYLFCLHALARKNG